MAVSVMARCGQSASFAGQRRFHAQPACRAPVSLVRVARPKMSPARAFYRSGNCYNNWDEEATKVCLNGFMQNICRSYMHICMHASGDPYLLKAAGNLEELYLLSSAHPCISTKQCKSMQFNIAHSCS